MNVNRWFSIAKGDKYQRFLITFSFLRLFSFFESFFPPHQWTCLSVDGTTFVRRFVNSVATKNTSDIFEKGCWEMKTTATGDIMLSFISRPHGRRPPQVSLISFFVSWVFCYDKIYRQFVSLDLKVRRIKKEKRSKSPKSINFMWTRALQFTNFGYCSSGGWKEKDGGM